jgi:hypothetical protein
MRVGGERHVRAARGTRNNICSMTSRCDTNTREAEESIDNATVFVL